MPKEMITMSNGELDRVSIIESVIAKRLRQHIDNHQTGIVCAGPV